MCLSTAAFNVMMSKMRPIQTLRAVPECNPILPVNLTNSKQRKKGFKNAESAQPPGMQITLPGAEQYGSLTRQESVMARVLVQSAR